MPLSNNTPKNVSPNLERVHVREKKNNPSQHLGSFNPVRFRNHNPALAVYVRRGPPPASRPTRSRVTFLIRPPPVMYLAAPVFITQDLLLGGVVGALRPPPPHRRTREGPINAELDIAEADIVGAAVGGLVDAGVVEAGLVARVVGAGLLLLGAGDGLAVGAHEPAADGAQRHRVALAVAAPGLLLVPRRRRLAEQPPERPLVQRPAHGDADADERDGHLGCRPDDQADAVLCFCAWLGGGRRRVGGIRGWLTEVVGCVEAFDFGGAFDAGSGGAVRVVRYGWWVGA